MAWLENVWKEEHRLGAAPARPLIGRAPERLRTVDPGAFEPQVVSIGPYHHGRNPNLNPMEAHKLNAVQRFVQRLSSNASPKDVDAAIMQIVPQLMDSYAVLEEQWRDGQRFMVMMVRDGCFVLEVLQFWTSTHHSLHEMGVLLGERSGRRRVMRLIARDMLLVENQLPMLALTTLARFTNINSNKMEQVYEGIKRLYCLSELPSRDSYAHILDEYWQCRTQGDYSSLTLDEEVCSAMELSDDGVLLTVSKSDNFRDIKFSMNRTQLWISSININDDTKTVLLNLMAYEFQDTSKKLAVVSYVWFLNCLLKTTKDVELMRRRGIIRGWVGRDAEVLELFNKLFKEVNETILFRDDRRSWGGLREVCSYRRQRLLRWRSSFMRAFLQNPWGYTWAALLLGLIILQSVYTILPLYKNK